MVPISNVCKNFDEKILQLARKLFAQIKIGTLKDRIFIQKLNLFLQI